VGEVRRLLEEGGILDRLLASLKTDNERTIGFMIWPCFGANYAKSLVLGSRDNNFKG